MNNSTRLAGLLLCFTLLFTYVIQYPIYANSKDIIDTSTSSDGYYIINYSDSNPVKMKVAVSYDDIITYYDYTANEVSIYAFTKGNGIYTITLYRNVKGTSYKRIETEKVNVKLKSSLAPYLISTKEITFSKDDAVSQKAAEICEGLTSIYSKTTAIHKYVHDNISYNYELAANVSSGKITTYAPKAIDVFNSHMGICCDFATLFAAMCRSQGIPCRIKKGYYQSIYHAWNEVCIDGFWYKVDTTTSMNKAILKKNKQT